MCCNGTLFNYVTLVPDDLPKLEKYPQIKFIIRSEQSTFDEPCVLHNGKGCSAYEDRPDTCSRYTCGVLRAVLRNELSEKDGLLLIEEGKALVENVKEYVAFEPGLPIAVSTWEAPPEGIEEAARFAWERTAYHLGKHFLGTVSEEVQAPQQTAASASSPPRFQRDDLYGPETRKAIRKL